MSRWPKPVHRYLPRIEAMTSTALAKRDTVDPSTGEVLSPFDMATYLSDLRSSTHITQQKALAAAYDAACSAIIGPNDQQQEGGRTFKKKSAWRKLARYFRISTEIVGVQHETSPETGKFLATVRVRASAPWNQYAEAVGACGTDEASGRRTITMADAIATAETRATNRAISNLIAMGEVSAEERQSSGNDTNQPAAAKKMPFGAHKGEPLGEIDTEALQTTIKWCREKDAAKFKDLIAACEEVIFYRTEGDEVAQ